MCIGVRAFEASQRREGPLYGDKAGDQPRRSRPPPCGYWPTGDLVEVVPDARDLAGALALDGPCRCGPGPRPRHRLAQQRGRRHARRSRLLPPDGVFRRRDPGGDHHGAMLSHGRTGDGARGPRPHASAAPPAARQAGGSKGGAATPRQPRCSTSRVLAPGQYTGREPVRRMPSKLLTERRRQQQSEPCGPSLRAPNIDPVLRNLVLNTPTGPAWRS